MKFLFAGNLIFLLTVVHSFPFPRPTGSDFPPFPPPPRGDNFFGDSESRANSGASASSLGEGIDGFRRFGSGCAGNPGFPEGPDGHDGFGMSEGGFHREEHHGFGEGPPFNMGDGFDVGSMAGSDASSFGRGGGPPFMMGDGFDAGSMAGADASSFGRGGGPRFMMGDGLDAMSSAGANAGTGANAGSPFLGGGANGAFGSATAIANAGAGVDAGPKSAQSVAQAKSDTISSGNGVVSSATSFSASSTS